MYYFGYCTFLEEKELRRHVPDAIEVTKARAANREVRFHAAGNREDRGWCHLADRGEGVYGSEAQGIVFEVSERVLGEHYDDFDIVFLTVHGDDGKTYDCFTYVLSEPGVPMRPPNYYWQHIPDGLADQHFSQEYIDSVRATYESAAPCPDADRAAPVGPPGRDSGSR